MILPGWWTIMSRTCQSPSFDRYSNTPLSSGPGDPRAIGTYGVLVGMFLAVVTWPTLITRNTRLQSLGRGRICPSGPPGGGSVGTSETACLTAFKKAWAKMPYQPNEECSVGGGVKSFAELPACRVGGSK